MKVLNPSDHTPMTITPEQTQQFEAFLDRNFPRWRAAEIFAKKNAGTIRRDWMQGQDEIERGALFRIGFVEVYDRTYGLDEFEEGTVQYGKQFICDIDGDLTPVAIWAHPTKS